MATQPPGTGLALFQGGGALPAHIANFFEAEGQNIQPRSTVPSLMITGKVWTISVDGQKSPLQARNADGDLTPLPIFKGIVLEYNKQRGRSYYEGAYDPNNTSQPMCWSDDGVAPEATLPGPFTSEQIAAMTPDQQQASRKISTACATCPKAVKGSRVIPGTNKATVACAEHRMLAVLPDPAMQLPAQLMKPLRLKIAITSDWDAQSPDQEQQGWLSWSKYVDWLIARGVRHTGGIITKMKFDPEAAYPKIFFSAERILEPNEVAMVQGLLHSPDTTKLLGGTWTPAGADGVAKEGVQTAPQPAPAVEAAAVAVTATPVAPAPAPTAEVAIPAGYKIADESGPTYDAFKTAGWTDDQLISHGKLIAAAPPPQPTEVVVPPLQTEPTAPASAAVIVAAPAAQPAPETPAVVVATPAEPQTSAPDQPAAPPPAQEPAQASTPAPTVVVQPADPPAAAVVAAEASPTVSTEVPGDVAALLEKWK